MKEEGEEVGEVGKRGGLTDVSCHLQIPRHYGTLPGASREGRTGTWPYQKSDQNRTRIQVLCQEEVISLQSSAQAEALQPDSCVQDQGTRKKGEERKERKGERSIKSLVPYRSGHSGQLSASGGDQGQKGPSCGRWVWSIGKQAGP